MAPSPATRPHSQAGRRGPLRQQQTRLFEKVPASTGGRESLCDQPDDQVHVTIVHQLPGLTYAGTRKVSLNDIPGRGDASHFRLKALVRAGPPPDADVTRDRMPVEDVKWDSDEGCALLRGEQPGLAHYGNHKRHRAAYNSQVCPVEDHLAAPQAAQRTSTEPESTAPWDEQEGSSDGQ